MKYILSEKTDECIFCKKIKENKDNENYILKRTDDCIIIMNIYPYNNGHLMVAPIEHIGDMQNLDDNVLFNMMQLVKKAQSVLSETMNPDGFNVGINLGAIAGAGIVDHIHIHIVPRWQGDTNYMPIIGDTRVIPEALDNTYENLHSFFK